MSGNPFASMYRIDSFGTRSSRLFRITRARIGLGLISNCGSHPAHVPGASPDRG